jgi:hypothetical protein
MSKKIIYSFFMLFFVYSCVTTSVTKLNESKNYTPISPDSVVVYLTPKDILCDFDKVALIKTKSGYALKDKKSIKKARKKAAKLGANGILVNGIKDPSTGEKVANAFLFTGASKKGKMLAIYVKDTGCKE